MTGDRTFKGRPGRDNNTDAFLKDFGL